MVKGYSFFFSASSVLFRPMTGDLLGGSDLFAAVQKATNLDILNICFQLVGMPRGWRYPLLLTATKAKPDENKEQD